MKITRRRLARELVRLLREQPARRKELLQQTAAYLIETRQAHQAHLLVHDIARELAQTDAHLAVEVRTAFGLNADTRSAVTALIKRTMNAKTVEIDERVAPELLGGVVIRTPELELDTSVRGQLNRIAGGIK